MVVQSQYCRVPPDSCPDYDGLSAAIEIQEPTVQWRFLDVHRHIEVSGDCLRWVSRGNPGERQSISDLAIDMLTCSYTPASTRRLAGTRALVPNAGGRKKNPTQAA